MSRTQSKNLTVGVLLILIGSLFLARNLHVLPYNFFHYVFNWYGWLMMIGLVLLIKHPGRAAGYILFGIGSIFLLQDLDYLPYMHARIIWPLILIGAGIFYIIRQQQKTIPKGEAPDGSMDFIDDTNIFGGGDVIVESDNFKGGRISSIFGGGSYDLRQSKLSAETKNVLDVFAMFGGSTIIVPADWNVRIEVTALFGGFSDKRKSLSDSSIKDPRKELFIKGFVMFGGGEVKS